jgi:hypothetical protein
MLREPFSALGVAAFSLAAYQDGAIWQSGLFAGIAASWLYVIVYDYLQTRHSRS